MPITADQVEVEMSADIAGYLRNINTAESAFFKSMQKMGREATVAFNAIDIASYRASQGFDRAGASANRLGGNVGNISAQFQDIAVTSAAGMNPLIIALQQGTQLSGVLNQSLADGVSPARALGSAFLQVLNPVSLATIAVVALGAAAVQAIASIVPESETATDAIKRHKEALEGIVEGYDAAEEAVSDYVDAASRLPQSVVLAKTEQEFQAIRDEAEAFRQEAASLGTLFVGFGSQAEQSLSRISAQFASGEITAKEYWEALQDVRGELSGVEQAFAFLPNGIQSVITRMEEGALKAHALADALNLVIAASHTFAAGATATGTDNELSRALNLGAYVAEQERINGLTTEQLQLESEIARIKQQASKFGITDVEAARLAEQTLAAEQRRAEIRKQMQEAGRSGKSLANEYENEREAMVKLLDAMGLQVDMLGMTNKEKAIAVALSKANASATAEELETIAATAGYIYDTEQAIKQLNETSKMWSDTLQTGVRGIIDDLISGKSAAEAFGNALSMVGSKLIDVGLSSLFGSGGFNVAGLFGGARAAGGPVSGGKAYLVGERGPELFRPSSAGAIVPNNQLGGTSVTFAPTINAPNADAGAVARIERALDRMKNDIVPTIRKEIRDGPKKGRN